MQECYIFYLHLFKTKTDMRFLKITAFIQDPEARKLGIPSETFYQKEVNVNIDHITSIEESISQEGYSIVNMINGISYLTDAIIDEMLDLIYD